MSSNGRCGEAPTRDAASPCTLVSCSRFSCDKRLPKTYWITRFDITDDASRQGATTIYAPGDAQWQVHTKTE